MFVVGKVVEVDLFFVIVDFGFVFFCFGAGFAKFQPECEVYEDGPFFRLGGWEKGRKPNG